VFQFPWSEVGVAGASDEQFRVEARAWLEIACPASMRTPLVSPDEEIWGGRRGVFFSEDARVWLSRMAERGWTAPTWPAAYGGGGLAQGQARVLAEEMRDLGCRVPLKSLGLWMLGPTLLEFGTEEQKREHVTKIARGEIRWCQGFSEPGAGSDLAGLQTRAVRDGDEWVVDGQKVWTSHADKADWIFCLVRTDPGAKKQEGIGFLLIDMASPGIRTRPLTLISGASPFCETFFENVRVPARNMVGAPNEGWKIAKRLLEHEREAISRMRDAQNQEEEPLEAIAKRYLPLNDDGTIADASLRDRLTQANLDFLCNKLTLRRSKETIAAGRPPGPEISMFKLVGTEINKRRRDLLVLFAGYQGLGWEGDAFTPEELQRTRDWLRSRANTIEGGSSEIQLNILAKRVLGLPD
jgi:alkylation response protein AidB-like acyl-CoA dehydrogenase